MISVAIKEGGPNPETNQKLKVAIEKAHFYNVPKENIERAIKRATGKDAVNEKLKEVSFEAFGPGGIAIIIEGITDNKNRTLGEIKQILSQHNGKLVGEGAVRWLFEKKGVISVGISGLKDKEGLEMAAIESGAQDFRWYDDNLEIYTKPEDLEKVRKILEEKGVKTESVSLDWVAKEEISKDEKTKELCQKLFESLNELDSVQEIYSNIKLP